MSEQTLPETAEKKGSPIGRTLLIVGITFVLTLVFTFWFIRTYIYAADFKPVELSAQETIELNEKLRVLGYEPDQAGTEASQGDGDLQWLRPERYEEDDSARLVSFSERELNGVIANNKDLARKLAVDLSDDLVSARLLVPVDPDFPILGGKTLRVSAGLEMSFSDARPKVILKGVSLMGVPIPAAWLGGLKNVDLIDEFGDQDGFWSGFAEGVDHVEVKEGRFRCSSSDPI